MSALSYPSHGTAPLSPTAKFLLAEFLFIAFNALDALFTAVYVGVGVATESNPLLAAAIAISPVLFVTVKMTLAIVAVVILHTLRNHRGAQQVMIGGALAYAGVVGWHLVHLPIGLPVAIASLP